MKLKLKLVFFVLMVAIAGCSDRSEKFLDGYAEIEIIEFGNEDYIPENNYEYINGHDSSNTLEAIKKQLAILKGQSEATEALADVYKTTIVKTDADKKDPDHVKQCIVVHRPGMSQSTLTHELGHCFHTMYFDVLEEKAPKLLSIIKSDNEDSQLFIESFAEIVAGTVAFDIDGDHSYLNRRIEKLENTEKSKEMAPYINSLPVMRNLRDFLDKSDLPSKREDQVRFILDNFYLNPQYNDLLIKK